MDKKSDNISNENGEHRKYEVEIRKAKKKYVTTRKKLKKTKEN